MYVGNLCILHALGDFFKIGHTVRKQLNLLIQYSEILKRAIARLSPFAYNLFKSVIRCAAAHQKLIARTEYAEKCDRKRVCTVYKAVSYKSILPTESGGVHLIQKLSAKVVITVSGGAMQGGFSDIIFSKRRQNLYAVILSNIINSCKDLFAFLLGFLCQL